MRLRNILILLVILIIVGGIWYFASRPEPAPEPEPKLYVWLIEMEEIQHIKIELPREEMSQAFIKEEDRSWHFDDPQRSAVDMQRWGGGIPLLLSGPGVERVIAENATAEQLTEFGLAQPKMRITLTLEDGDTLDIKVGDRTPNGAAFYVKVPRSNDVCLVDYTWYEVLARLVKEPPYPPPPTD